MPFEQVVRAKDDQGNPQDLGEVLDDAVSYGMRTKSPDTDSRLDSAISELQDIESDLEALVSATGDTLTAGTVRELLLRIYNAVDGLELSVGNIDIDLDDVETLLSETNARLGDEADAEAVGSGSINAVLKRVRTRLDQFITDFNAEDFSSETTQSAFKAEAHADSLDEQAAVDELKAQNLSKHDSIIAELQDVEADIEALVAATGDTLTTDTVRELLLRIYNAVDGLELSIDNIDIDMDDVETLLSETNSRLGDETDVEATGNGSINAVVKRLRTRLDQLITDFNAEDFASETTQLAFKAESHADSLDEQAAVDELKAQNLSKHDSIIAELQDVEADIEALVAATGDTVTTNTVRELLLRIYNAVDGLELSIDNIDIDMDDVETLLTETNARLGDETDAEATGNGSINAIAKRLRTRLDQLITDFNAEDFASETTLSSIASDISANHYTLEQILKIKINIGKMWLSEESISGTTKTLYAGVADEGTLTSSATFSVVRVLEDLSAGKRQVESRQNIAWNNRADPTIDGGSAWSGMW